MNKEYITYEQVQQGACQILKEAGLMKEIFDAVTGNMTNMTATDNFQGVASDELAEQFRPFQAKFDEFVKEVENFAKAYNVSSDTLEETERRLKAMANDLG
jgi:uncharacterized protein YukE